MSDRLRIGEPVPAPALERIERARERHADLLVRTPLVAFHPPGPAVEPPLLLKLETLQPIGSFKLRGVLNAVAGMSDEERAPGLSTVSAGNTAQALAWCGRLFGVAAYSLMPESAPQTKTDAVRAFGGTPRLVPRGEVFRFLKEGGWRSEPYAFVHPWLDREVIAGHGTLGLELAEDAPGLATVYVPVGGGGLLAGVAGALAHRLPEAEIVAVEPSTCPALATALERDRPVEVECSTICDGIAVPYITEEMFPLLRELVDEVMVIDDVDTKRAMRRLALQQKVVAEPSGAIALAAALARRERRPAAGTEACIVSGGSVAPGLLAQVLDG